MALGVLSGVCPRGPVRQVASLVCQCTGSLARAISARALSRGTANGGAAAQVATTIRARMDSLVVGHAELKRAITLGIVAREHVYVEGPPGVGKTMLAEVAAEATSLDFYFYQMHRDTRLQEMVGNSVIVREVDATGGEVIRQKNEPGGMVTAELCVLDDVSRAPGEALNILLRILNERKFGGDPIPLLCAIATANPADDAYYNEPLDPANMDRFALQVQASGLIQQQCWDDAANVIQLFASHSGGVANGTDEVVESVSRELLDAAYAELQAVEVTTDVAQHLVTFLHLLTTRFGLTEHNSLLTDRTFLVKAIKILKAQACVTGRDRTAPEDIEVLSFLTTFRVPPAIHLKIPSILADIVERKIAPPAALAPSRGASAGSEELLTTKGTASTSNSPDTGQAASAEVGEDVVMSPRHPVPKRLLLDKVDTGQPPTSADPEQDQVKTLLQRLSRGKGKL